MGRRTVTGPEQLNKSKTNRHLVPFFTHTDTESVFSLLRLNQFNPVSHSGKTQLILMQIGYFMTCPGCISCLYPYSTTSLGKITDIWIILILMYEAAGGMISFITQNQ